MKLVGGAWCAACAATSCISHLKKGCVDPPALACGREELLHCRFLLQPVVEVLLGHYLEVCFHVVVSQATKLSADNFVLADLGGREVQGNIQPGNKILLHPQLPYKERVPKVFRMHEQMDFLVHRNCHLGGDDVVFGIRIMVEVETKVILRALINEFRVQRSERAIRTGVAEIEGELPGLDLDRHGVGRGWDEIYVGPCLHPEDSEGQDLQAHDQESSNHQTRGAAGKLLNLCIGPRVGELPDENSQKELCGEKSDSSFRHGF